MFNTPNPSLGIAGASEASEASEASGSIFSRTDDRSSRTIGVSPSPTPQTAGGVTWWPGNKWPPVFPTPSSLTPPKPPFAVWQLMPPSTTFTSCVGYRAWDAEHWATVVLAEYTSMVGTGGPLWMAPWPGAPAAPVGTPPETEQQAVFDLIPYRPSVMAEAMAQNNAILQYFAGILTFNPRSHPATCYLCAAALRIASFTVMYWKDRHNRARPSRLDPRLMPPIDPPGHASYPSGHSTQAHLIARFLEEVMPLAIKPTTGGREDGPLYLMAQRIGRNREVLGLHFRSDTDAGEKLAGSIHAAMLQCGKVVALKAAAQLEWNPTSVSEPP